MMQKLNYIRCGDYYIPDIRLPEENRPIGRWGRMHRDYIKEHKLIRFNDLCLSGELWTYLADLNELRTPLKKCSLTADDGASPPLEWCTASAEMVHGGRGRGAPGRHAGDYSGMPLRLRMDSPSIWMV